VTGLCLYTLAKLGNCKVSRDSHTNKSLQEYVLIMLSIILVFIDFANTLYSIIKLVLNMYDLFWDTICMFFS